jgi:glucose/mannose transport system permease protein
VLVHVVWGLPFTGLLFRGYFLSIPPEVFQLARLDGASFAVILFRLILPIVLPAIAAASILQFTFIWNDFLLGLTFGDSFKQPVTVALQALASAQYDRGSYNEIAAAAVMASLPTAILCLACGRLLVRGMPRQST